MKKIKQVGFTLIELMITVAIVGILAAVAYPSYTTHVIKSNRRAAQAQMLDIANRQQQFLLANRSYATTTELTNSGYNLPTEVSTRYSYAITIGTSTVPAYTITFTAIGGQVGDGALTFDSSGVKLPVSKMVVLSLRPVAVQRGASMIEVLVTMVIIAFGLLGIAGLQVRLQVSEMESYQRSQALLLLNDIANRVAVNRNNADSYLVAAASPLGAGMTCPSSITTTVQRDLSEWCSILQGAGETTSSGATKLGAMIGGRGCIEKVGSDYLLTVAWQGLTPIAAPASSVACGANSYDASAGSPCVNDKCRRTVTTLVRIATL